MKPNPKKKRGLELQVKDPTDNIRCYNDNN